LRLPSDSNLTANIAEQDMYTTNIADAKKQYLVRDAAANPDLASLTRDW